MNPIDKIRVQLNCDLPEMLYAVAVACVAQDTDGRLAQAATECRKLAAELGGAYIHPQLSAADVLVKAIDGLRLSGRDELVPKFESIIRLIKGGAKRRVVGQAIMHAKRLNDMLDKSDGVKILAMEHPESGDAVPIAKVK